MFSIGIVDKTNPKKVGPHTFSLVKKGLRPETTNEIKNCFRGPHRICYKVAVEGLPHSISAFGSAGSTRTITSSPALNGAAG
jgi:hypothetical protein